MRYGERVEFGQFRYIAPTAPHWKQRESPKKNFIPQGTIGTIAAYYLGMRGIYENQDQPCAFFEGESPVFGFFRPSNQASFPDNFIAIVKLSDCREIKN